MLFLLTGGRNPVIWNRFARREDGPITAVNSWSHWPMPHVERKEVPEIRPLQLARSCKELALDKKGEDILILDLRGLSSVTDYFVICHGTSRRHVQTIAEHIRLGLKKRDLREAHTEGFPEGRFY